MKFFWIFIFLGVFAVATVVAILVIVFNNFDELNIVEETNEELFQLSIIHINDFHARFEETNEQSLRCVEGQKCIGGFARMKTVVDQLKAKRQNAIFLNAGDNFQGTFWYNLLRYNVTSHFLNLMPADAMTLGNHEFAHRVEGLVPFLRTLTSPVLVCNMNDRYEPEMRDLFQKSLIIERSGRKIGIIGVIFRETSDVANTGDLIFIDEAKAIRDEATKLRQGGANIIIVLSHCGLDRERQIALETGDFVDVIVGGHSHSFLYTSIDKKSPGPDTAVGSYPIVVTPKSGSNRKVLIVQASAFTKYVGDLTVYFNAEGHVRYYEGNPIFLSSEIEKDPEIEEALVPWRKEVDRLGQRVVGKTSVDLLHTSCRHGECALGSFAADAFVYETRLALPETLVFASIIQAAGMRSGFTVGDVKYADIVAFMPFETTLDILELPGNVIMEVFEHSVSRSFVEEEFIGIHMLQVSGLKLRFNVTKPVGQRLLSIQIQVNESGDFENLNPHKLYTLIVPSFIANGGDGFTIIRANRRNHRVGLLDIDVVESFVLRRSPISSKSDGRIVMLT